MMRRMRATHARDACARRMRATHARGACARGAHAERPVAQAAWRRAPGRSRVGFGQSAPHTVLRRASAPLQSRYRAVTWPLLARCRAVAQKGFCGATPLMGRLSSTELRAARPLQARYRPVTGPFPSCESPGRIRSHVRPVPVRAVCGCRRWLLRRQVSASCALRACDET